MRNLIIILTLFWCSIGFCQTSTNKIQNTATMYLTNSTLYVGSTQTVFNGTRYLTGESVTIYGIDGTVRMIPLASHGRANIYWVTNADLKVPTWQIGQDIPGSGTHNFGIGNLVDSKLPLLIYSNQVMSIDIVRMVCTSNLVVTNTITCFSTNNSRHFMVNGIPPFTGSVTNLGPDLGSSNVLVYSSGIVTNYYKIP